MASGLTHIASRLEFVTLDELEAGFADRLGADAIFLSRALLGTATDALYVGAPVFIELETAQGERAIALEGVEGNDLRGLMDQLKSKLGSGVILLGAANGEKVSLIAGVTNDLIAKVKAGELVNMAAAQVGGKGGGKPDMAQAGGSQPANLPKALESVYGWVEGKL